MVVIINEAARKPALRPGTVILRSNQLPLLSTLTAPVHAQVISFDLHGMFGTNSRVI